MTIEHQRRYAHRGKQNSHWNGGRHIEKSSGYVELTITPDDPLYCMSDHGAILEHRYVMAKHLGRPLTTDELVHHRGIRYPIFSKENKGDNLCDNLKLVTRKNHSYELYVYISELESEVARLRKELEEAHVKT